MRKSMRTVRHTWRYTLLDIRGSEKSLACLSFQPTIYRRSKFILFIVLGVVEFGLRTMELKGAVRQASDRRNLCNFINVRM